jgi:O-antigen/teichoic acid export membrane protein
MVQWFSSNFFTLVAGIYLGVNALGALRLVQSFFGVINVILQTVENYYLPKTAQLHYQDKKKKITAFQYVERNDGFRNSDHRFLYFFRTFNYVIGRRTI